MTTTYTLTTVELILRDKMNEYGFIVSLEADPTWDWHAAAGTNPLYTEKMFNQALADLESLKENKLLYEGWHPVRGRLTSSSPIFIFEADTGSQVGLSANVDDSGNPTGRYCSVLNTPDEDGYLYEIYMDEFCEASRSKALSGRTDFLGIVCYELWQAEMALAEMVLMDTDTDSDDELDDMISEMEEEHLKP